ncbi:MAG: OsmC family protein [Pseudomonadota bacterium]|nr:OsmC family protein [Pseudomonadota bacterium]
MAIRQKNVIQGKMRGRVVSPERTTVSVRDLQVDLDEPTERGGTNTGLTPTETAISALIGCTNVVGHRCAKLHGVEVQAMEIDVVYDLDRTGVMLQAEVRVPFKRIELRVRLTTTADEDAVGRMRSDLSKFCAISVLFRAAGTEIVETWDIVRP